MQTNRIVSRLLEGCVPFMHAARWHALCDTCEAAVCGNALSLSRLACGTPRAIALRHCIKCVDRLLGNRTLHRERQPAYQALAHRWLSDLPPQQRAIRDLARKRMQLVRSRQGDGRVSPIA